MFLRDVTTRRYDVTHLTFELAQCVRILGEMVEHPLHRVRCLLDATSVNDIEYIMQIHQVIGSAMQCQVT